MGKKSFYIIIGTTGLIVLAFGVHFLNARFETIDQASSVPPPATSQPLASPSISPTSPSASASPGPHDLEQVRVLDEILASRNDNDPRLDSVLKGFSPAAKALLRQKYGSLPAEKRNQRGTVVFLLGREIASAEDVVFLGSVLSEQPCLSLTDCSREEKSGGDTHGEMGMNITLAYPQLVVLNSFEKKLTDSSSASSPDIIESIKKYTDAASRSPVPAIASKATDLLNRAKNH